jgi:hypothetical protein
MMRCHFAYLTPAICLGFAAVAMAGVFRKDQDFHFIRGFGGIQVIDGRPMIGKEGNNYLVPLGTQLHIDGGSYLIYDPDSTSTSVGVSVETNLKAQWEFVTKTLGRIPGRGSPDKAGRYTQTNEVRVQAKSGPFKSWYLGVDRSSDKPTEDTRTKDPDAKPRVYPLVLVKDRAEALVFGHEISGIYE